MKLFTCSKFMTFLLGDIISTGTSNSMGLGFNPTIYSKQGNMVELVESGDVVFSNRINSTIYLATTKRKILYLIKYILLGKVIFYF
jgi:2-keto-4-pentenoate hydratase/2-oxohepta-3-ene-1,7-dioic acid hydratase in catechol pathway